MKSKHINLYLGGTLEGGVPILAHHFALYEGDTLDSLAYSPSGILYNTKKGLRIEPIEKRDFLSLTEQLSPRLSKNYRLRKLFL